MLDTQTLTDTNLIPQKDYEVQFYAAFHDNGNLLRATVSADYDACEKALHKFNPRLEGFYYPYRILPIKRMGLMQ